MQKKELIFWIILIAVVAVIVFLMARNAEAKVKPHHYEWGVWHDQTECEQLRCGSERGEKTIEQHCNKWRPGWAKGNPKACKKGKTRTKVVGCCVKDPEPCEEEGKCPTFCGYKGGVVPDGDGGNKKCEPTKPCPEPKPEKKGKKTPCDHDPDHILGFRFWGGHTLKWNTKGSVDKVDVKAFDGSFNWLWNTQTDDDGSFYLGNYPYANCFQIRGVNKCGHSSWTKLICR